MKRVSAVYLTREGEIKLRSELDELRGPRRQEIAGRLRNAIELGDLSENADYITAKEEQAFLEGKILELEATLREAVIVDSQGPSNCIAVGSTVVLQENGHPPETFQLVGVKEVNPRQGKISHESPIGKSILGRSVGEVVQAETPGGLIELTILEIQ